MRAEESDDPHCRCAGGSVEHGVGAALACFPQRQSRDHQHERRVQVTSVHFDAGVTMSMMSLTSTYQDRHDDDDDDDADDGGVGGCGGGGGGRGGGGDDDDDDDDDDDGDDGDDGVIRVPILPVSLYSNSALRVLPGHGHRAGRTTTASGPYKWYAPTSPSTSSITACRLLLNCAVTVPVAS
eukprot:1598131-Rhodomonas_salina.9